MVVSCCVTSFRSFKALLAFTKPSLSSLVLTRWPEDTTEVQAGSLLVMTALSDFVTRVAVACDTDGATLVRREGGIVFGFQGKKQSRRPLKINCKMCRCDTTIW